MQVGDRNCRRPWTDLETNIKEWINVNLTITEKFSGCFLEKTMVSVLHKELEYKVENLKYKKVGGHAAEDQNQIWTSSWWINHPRSVHMKID